MISRRMIKLSAISAFIILGINNIALADQTIQDPAIKKVLPNTPEQIKRFKSANRDLEIAEGSTPISKKDLSNTVKTINLTDGATPPLLHLVRGFTTNISFIGENGKPWKILNAVSGGSVVDVIQPAKAHPYTAAIKVKTAWLSGNVSFYLEGKVNPVILYVNTAADLSRGLDGNVTMKIDGLPPGTSPQPIENVATVSNELLNALDHAPGNNWQSVSMADDSLPVHLHYWVGPQHNRAIIRIAGGTLVMPEWGSQASSPDQTTTAYEFNHVPLMFWVASDSGKNFQLRIGDPTTLLAGGETSIKVKDADANNNDARGEL